MSQGNIVGVGPLLPFQCPKKKTEESETAIMTSRTPKGKDKEPHEQ
jgi:hypothetical protein